MTEDSWGRARHELLKTVGQNNFTTWIEPLTLAEFQDGIARFLAPTNFMRDWVSRNFAEQIRQHLNNAGLEVERVEFHVADARSLPAARPPRRPATTATTLTASLAEDPLPGAPLDARFVFDTFVVGKPNALAHAAARRVAEGGPVSFNPLFLYGGVGLGKTHLMHAITNELRSRHPEKKVIYLSAEQFMYRFIQALREREVIAFKELFRGVDVLMVDDLQFIAGKDSTQEEFFHTFNAL
ncbi:MAG: ATP-binding protein, partial [Rhodobacteraceae bacterium]|nr:ATP-binding protein [Paracoccaceae bacterium]